MVASTVETVATLGVNQAADLTGRGTQAIGKGNNQSGWTGVKNPLLTPSVKNRQTVLVGPVSLEIIGDGPTSTATGRDINHVLVLLGPPIGGRFRVEQACKAEY